MEEGLTKRIWLHLLSEGGRWSPREISMDLREPYEDVRKASARMYDTGSVLRHERGEDRSISYSIGDTCRVPNGATLGDVRKALRTAGETV